MKSQIKSSETSLNIPEQELNKYNRESGKKTLYFVGLLISLIVILSVAVLIYMNSSK